MSYDTCVIGGSGFIGRSLVPLLVATGRRVLVLGRRSASPVIPAGASYRALDITDTSEVLAALRGVRELVDLAYAFVPKTSCDDPVADVLGNLPPSVALMVAAAELDLRSFVLVSSGGTVYGEPDVLPITEKHPQRPISPYGITKHALECYGMLYHRSLGLPVVIARPANAYGEAQDGSSGQGFIGAAVRNLLAGHRVPVYGAPGTIRDYIHVDDVATGLLALLEKGRFGEEYNLGTGRGHNNIEILSMLGEIAEHMGLPCPEVEALPARPFDVTANVLSYEKLKREADWGPSISIQSGLERVLRHAAGREH